MSLRTIINGRAMYGDEDFERELEKAYREGRREERERMEEHYGYGERGGYGSGSGSGSGSGRGGGSYGQRDGMYYMDDEEEEYEYGERRGVKGTGPYSRYYRRRR